MPTSFDSPEEYAFPTHRTWDRVATAAALCHSFPRSWQSQVFSCLIGGDLGALFAKYISDYALLEYDAIDVNNIPTPNTPDLADAMAAVAIAKMKTADNFHKTVAILKHLDKKGFAGAVTSYARPFGEIFDKYVFTAENGYKYKPKEVNEALPNLATFITQTKGN
jgi:hypothetical protein